MPTTRGPARIRRRIVRGLILLLIASMFGVGAPAATQSASDAIASVRAFAEQYQREAPSLVALEEYVQNVTNRSGQAQVTTAELVMVRLPGSASWVTFRDVLTVNKRPIRDREERLLKLLQSPEASALAQAQRIAQESARYNLGRITRTMNVPDMALEYLQPRHGARIRFETLRNETIEGQPVVVLRFSEAAGPSIVRNMRGADLLARGRVWAEPGSGAIVRTELLVADRASNGTSTVEFRIDPRLGIRVPIKMTERYSMSGETIDAVARYSDFRRFTVSTGEKLTKPPGR
jgi:hypothetical protein